MKSKVYRFRCLTFKGRDTTYIVNTAVNDLQAVTILMSMVQRPCDEMSESAEWIVSIIDPDSGSGDDMLVSWSELCIWACH